MATAGAEEAQKWATPATFEGCDEASCGLKQAEDDDEEEEGEGEEEARDSSAPTPTTSKATATHHAVRKVREMWDNLCWMHQHGKQVE